MTVSSVSTTSSARKSNKQMMTRSDIQSVKGVKRSPAFSDSTLSNKKVLFINIDLKTAIIGQLRVRKLVLDVNFIDGQQTSK